jgi:hypothetical protein
MLLGALAVASGLMVANAKADISLPAGAQSVRFDGVAAFDTSFEPFINVLPGDVDGVITGQLVDNPDAGPLELTAFGSITSIVDATNTLNKGSITNGQELTFTYTGATLTPIAVAPAIPVVGETSVTYSITSQVTGGTITLYEDDSADLNTAAFFGQPAVVPGEAEDGDVFLTASTPETMVGDIVITYNRLDSTSPFTTYTIQLQSLNGGAFDITGGSLADANPGLFGQKIQANQLGLFNSAFDTQDVDVEGETVTVNAPVDKLVEGAVQMTITIPEPASLGLLVVAGLLLLSGRRTWRQEA